MSQLPVRFISVTDLPQFLVRKHSIPFYSKNRYPVTTEVLSSSEIPPNRKHRVPKSPYNIFLPAPIWQSNFENGFKKDVTIVRNRVHLIPVKPFVAGILVSISHYSALGSRLTTGPRRKSFVCEEQGENGGREYEGRGQKQFTD